ncbi:30S ribosomal protein S9 [Candidatus Peribacteria bacterium]|jgi:small subunit ribosomal protein S9|nr:30S ribosomal protein S9 [Candidatus Peribacteria bacterium]MBT4021216.1 30S ribosomal protein S9 [Candidatus Peribacteria bacterium]MBT4240708.1 30S ribosomal protein S9 [Candidatus Peribacteria bacterium]MBT4473961.1 30S ribosomal protein S9 [Candidatus Peribacteria bacterium]
MAKAAQYFYGTGKRKTSIARVRLFENGTGKCTVNTLPFGDYFFHPLTEVALAPLDITDNKKNFDLEVKVEGGGKNSQSEAMRHGISRALLLFDPELRTTLKKAGFLRRDARIRERKKPGLKRARRAPQWCKR